MQSAHMCCPTTAAAAAACSRLRYSVSIEPFKSAFLEIPESGAPWDGARIFDAIVDFLCEHAAATLYPDYRAF